MIASEFEVQPATTGFDALKMLAHGSPLGRTLEAAVSVVAGNHREIGCCILLVSDDRFSIATARQLQAKDEQLLRRVCRLPLDECLTSLSQEHQVEMRVLLTAASELIGAVVAFSCNSSRDHKLSAQLDEVRAIATIAVESKHLADELYFRAHHDALTQIWNRLWMEEEIARVLEDSISSDRGAGLLFIGLDSFRTINELLGPRVGNELLRNIALRLTDALRPGWSVARCGGDEFLVLLPHLLSSDQVQAFATELLYVFDQPFDVGDHELLIRATVGTCFSLPGECRSDDLQTKAETALRYGKRCARGRVSAFSSSMISTPPERLEMERHLRFALQKRELEVYYQPQIHLATGRLLATEALLRWKHPSLGFISPASFIPIAEQIGVIDEIGVWVLSEAVHQLEKWHRAGLDDLRVAVNVSALQFSKDDFASSVAKCLRRSNIKPENLELEITESAVMTDFDHASRQIRLLRSLGVLIALDDFGTGHSSLAYLQQLPIQRIKIDRMFVRDITSATENHPLLSSIIQMGHALGCAVIAEGIETAEQAMAVAGLECDEVQGFFFGRPLPGSEVLPWAKAMALHEQ